MLTESSLTNTLTLSGVSNIRYRVYTQSYQKSTLLSFLTCEELHVKSPSYIENKKVQNSLIKAFRHLIHLNIPSVWHITPSQDKELIALELWVFWFDDRHTGIIDNSVHLKELKELKVGSFNWDQLTSSGLSPTASPQLNRSTTDHATITPGNEYKLFIKSIRNLIHHSMTGKGAFSLGEFFVFPDTYLEDNDVIDSITDNSKPAPTSVKNTMLACMYNIYLTSSNLVFQPNTRRMRIRPLSSGNMYSKNIKVLLCPTGEHASLISFQSLPTPELQQKVLEQWVKFYHLTPSQLLSLQKNEHLPSLVTIRTASDDIITYPTMLIFVPTDTKLSPSAVSGLNGIMGLNHGLTEDLGSKASRLAYYERLKSNTQIPNNTIIDYWSYRNPIIYSGNVVINSLSMIDTNYQQDKLLLHRALLEPVVSSPIMNSKSVIPINTTPLLGNATTFTSYSQHSSPPKSSLNTDMNLVEFAKSRFQTVKDKPVEAILDGLNPLNDPNIAMHSNENLDIGGGSHLSAMLKKNLTIDSTTSSDMAIDMISDNSSMITAPQQPQDAVIIDQPPPSPPLDDFGLGGMMYEIDGNNGDPWDVNEDFGDLDLDVTEADFDFFKTPAPALVVTPNNVLNIIPMNIVPVKEKNVSAPPPSVSTMGQSTIIQCASGQSTIEHSTSAVDQSNLLQDEDIIPIDIETTPNNDSLFTPFVISNTSTEDVSMNSSSVATVEPSTTPMRIDYLQPISTMQRRVPYQKSTPEPSTFVPHDFLPVPVNTSAIDAKYSAGGKFMYDPSSNVNKKKQQGASKKHPKRELYSPNYVPIVKKKIVKKLPVVKTLKKMEIVKSEKIDTTEDIKMTDVKQEKSSGSSGSSSRRSSSSGSSSASSSSSGSYTDDDSESEDSSDDSISNEQIVDKRLRTLEKFQKSVVYSFLKATPAPLPIDQFQNIDYDTPFAPILADGYIKPIKWRQSKAMEQSMKYLCQQAIWGGYPFAGGLAEVSENGGEIEGEAAKVLVARRTNIMQMTRGVVTHVPSLQTDTSKLTMEFKDMLNQIFVQQTIIPGTAVSADGMTTPMEDNSMKPISYLNGPLLGSVDVKGPLNIQQYYDLNESHNQAHSKYGKYQIKKRRPDEPNLDSLKQPDIVVSRYDDFLEGSPTMLLFWEKLGLEPYSTKKQVKYLAVYPDNPDIEGSVRQFFKSLSAVYDSCHLGKHDAGHTGPYQNGLVPVPLAALEDENETSVRQRLKSYEETCENLGRCLASNDNHNQNLVYIVIYIVNPSPHMSSYLDMCRCFYKLKEAYDMVTGMSTSNDHNRLVLQLVPIDHILRPSAFGGYTMLGMKDVAFSVYSKCFSVISRKMNPAVTTDLYAPPFVLTKPIQRTIQFKLDDIRPFPVILDQNANLHMAYCFSNDLSWMSAVWIDGRGELLEYALFSRKTAYKEAWERTMEIAKRTDFPWTIVIAKVGLMFNEELVHWMKYVSNAHNYWVTIVGLDLESGLNLHINACYPDTTKALNGDKNQQAPTLLDSHGRSHTMGGTGYQQQQDTNNLNNRNIKIVNEAQTLLLNHRISYSQKRERAYKGILRTEAITEKESWMTPLATGYLIHHSLPNKNVNPCMEQFNNEPFVVEIHLIYNHTQHSAYSTLQDIIKRLYALSFVNPVPSSHNCIPFHIVLAERLSRLLLIVDDSIK